MHKCMEKAQNTGEQEKKSEKERKFVKPVGGISRRTLCYCSPLYSSPVLRQKQLKQTQRQDRDEHRAKQQEKRDRHKKEKPAC